MYVYRFLLPSAKESLVYEHYWFTLCSLCYYYSREKSITLIKTVSFNIKHKHSGAPYDRPTPKQLSLGEIGLNVSETDPGLYIALNDNNTVSKIGPTAYGPVPPPTTPQTAGGETWFDTSNHSLNIWERPSQVWSKTHPTHTHTLFVNSTDSSSSDSLDNHGTHRPFQTLNRACLEVGRRTLTGDKEKFLIVLQSEEIAALNDKGYPVEKFTTSTIPFAKHESLSLTDLISFNDKEGGIIIPNGTSIIGLNPPKNTLRPSYVPLWNKEDGAEHTSLLRWDNGCSLCGLSFSDKTQDLIVFKHNNTLTTNFPHHLNSNNYETLALDQSLATTKEFVAIPLSPTTFELIHPNNSPTHIDDFPSPQFVLHRLNKTHHTVAAISDATEESLSNYYEKIKFAFSALHSELSVIQENRSNSPISVNQITLNTNYGMKGIVSSKTIQIHRFNYNANQSDPSVYEVYGNTKWTTTSSVPKNNYLNSRLYHKITPTVEGRVEDRSDCRFYGLLSHGKGRVSLGEFYTNSGERYGGLCAKSGGKITVRNSAINNIDIEGYFVEKSPSVFSAVGIKIPSEIPVSELQRPSNIEKIYINNTVKTITANSITFAKPLRISDLKPYSIGENSVVYFDSKESGIALRAKTVAGGTWISGDNSTINTAEQDADIMPDDVGTPYIKRFIDPRPPSDAHYYLHITTTAINHKPPSVGDIIRIEPQEVVTQGRQLDASDAGGHNRTFFVADVINKDKYDKFNCQYEKTRSLNHDYYISLGLLDNSLPWVTGIERGRGSVVTHQNLAYRCVEHDLDGDSLNGSVWEQHSPIPHQLPFNEENNDPLEFLPNENYTNHSFTRGITLSLFDYAYPILIDRDPEELKPPSDSTEKIISRQQTNPPWMHNTQATERFFELMGYSENDRQELMSGEKYKAWAGGEITFTKQPTLSEKYLNETGPIPLSMHPPSSVELLGHNTSTHSTELWGGRLKSH